MIRPLASDTGHMFKFDSPEKSLDEQWNQDQKYVIDPKESD